MLHCWQRLANVSLFSGLPRPIMDVVVDCVRDDELSLALRVVYQHLPPPHAEAQVVRGLRLVERGELPREGILVARGDGLILGAIVLAPLAGRSAVVWPPQVRPLANRWALEDELLQRGLFWLRQRGTRLIQALLPPAEAHLAAPLLRHGFRRLTRLLTLTHPLYAFTPADQPPFREPGLEFCPYDEKAPGLFHATLEQTYEQTLDCPELNGVRSIEEVIAGHRAQGEYDPARWLLVLEKEQAVGVLLLTAFSDWHEWDLSYLGLVPAARGRGLGRALVREAVRRARLAGTGQLTVAVDARNERALRIYTHLGFTLLDEREVFWRILER